LKTSVRFRRRDSPNWRVSTAVRRLSPLFSTRTDQPIVTAVVERLAPIDRVETLPRCSIADGQNENFQEHHLRLATTEAVRVAAAEAATLVAAADADVDSRRIATVSLNSLAVHNHKKRK
jgi:hypothetical protein